MICIHASTSMLGNTGSIQQSWVKKQAIVAQIQLHTYFPKQLLSQALSRQKALEL